MCNNFRYSLTKNVSPVGLHTGAFSEPAPIALKLSRRSGCVVDSLPFNLTTATRSFAIHLMGFDTKGSETRKPCEREAYKRQRSRASFLRPFGASINRSSSRPVRCFRQCWTAQTGQGPFGSIDEMPFFYRAVTVSRGVKKVYDRRIQHLKDNKTMTAIQRG